MHPLLYLAWHTMFNGVKRAFSSPSRLIGLLFTCAYFIYYGFFNPAFSTRGAANYTAVQTNFHLDWPIETVLDAAAFGLFVFLSLPMLSMVTKYNKVMRPADVDVLFPTPVSPKVVMFFRIVRDFLGTWIMPFFLLLFGRKFIPVALLTHNLGPDAGWALGRSFSLAWILLALAWVAIGYAATLFINRSDLASDRYKAALDWGSAILVVGTIAYFGLSLKQDLSFANVFRLLESPFVRIPYFPATLATAVSLGPVGHGYVVQAFVCAAILLAIIVAFFNLAVSQVSWMYDQAAVKGFESIESSQLRRSGDMAGLLAHQARMGKLRAGRQGWLQRVRVAGAWTMIWRELILQRRSARTGFIFVTLIALVYSLLPVFLISVATSSRHRTEDFMGYLVFGFQALGIFMSSMSMSQTGFIEFLRRVDVLKPLPFSSQTLVIAEMFGKSIIPIFLCWFGSIVTIGFHPELWPYILGAMAFMPSLAGVLTGITLVILLLFPDIDDPTQRSFRGLVTLLGIALTMMPGALALLGIVVLFHQFLLAALVATALNVAMIAGLGFIAGYQYMHYNPSE